MIVTKNGLLSKYLSSFQNGAKLRDGSQAFSAPHIENIFIRETPFLKRTMDIVFAVICLVLFLPIMIVAVVAIKLTSEGPVLYKQERAGEGGKTFTFLKFRSMYNNCDQRVHQEHIKKLSRKEIDLIQTYDNTCSSFKLQNDNRVTNIGKYLRRTSLDELPQLFNVLKGDMSLVGPRPYPVYEAECCTDWQRTRFCIRPGITGLSQVYARYNKSYIDAYRYDLNYVKNLSLWLDLKILFKTLPCAIYGRGAI
jgi:lipopolysaccharide/colanic/teichoic acid biosynthesis glycosyltransferase